MKLFNKLILAYKSVKHRNKIANINLNDLIRDNFDSACAVYKGFFGHPTVDNELMTIYKNVNVDYPIDRRLRDCQIIVNRFGFDVFSTKSNDGTSVKVILIPDNEIRAYMFKRSIGKEYPETINLYKSLGGHVI